MNQEIFDDLLNAQQKLGYAERDLMQMKRDRYKKQENMIKYISDDVNKGGSYLQLVHDHAVQENHGMDVIFEDEPQVLRQAVVSYIQVVYCFSPFDDPDEVAVTVDLTERQKEIVLDCTEARLSDDDLEQEEASELQLIFNKLG